MLVAWTGVVLTDHLGVCDSHTHPFLPFLFPQQFEVGGYIFFNNKMFTQNILS